MRKPKIDPFLEAARAEQLRSIEVEKENTETYSPEEIARAVVYTRQDSILLVTMLAGIYTTGRSIRRWLIGAVVLLFILTTHFVK